MGYIPPALRNNPTYVRTNLSLKLKPKPIDYTDLKTNEQIFKEIMNTNYGKADSAWE